MRQSRSSRRAFLMSSAVGFAGALLAACGATPAPTATTATEAEATQAPAAEATATSAPAATEGKVEIRWLDWSDQDDIINAAIERLKETHPNVTVNFEAIDGSNWGDKQLTQMVSGNPPDLLIGNDETSYKWAEKKQLLDLNPLVERDLTAEQIADFFEYQWNGLVYPGDQTRMGLPYYTWVYQYYYNMDAFDEAGLDYPKAGWTLDDYSAALEKLVKKEGDTITRWGGLDACYDPFRFALWAHIFGGNLVNPTDWTECAVSSDETKAAFEWHRERLWDTNTIIQQTQAGQLSVIDALATQKVAILGEGNGNEGMFLANPPAFKWACVAPPVGPTGKAEGIGTVDNWGIWAGTKAAGVVWDLAKIVALEDAFQEAFSAMWVATPNRKSILPKFKDAVKAKYPDATDGQIDPQLEMLNSGAVRIGEQFKKHKASTEILIPAMQKILQVGDGGVDILDAICEEITALNRE